MESLMGRVRNRKAGEVEKNVQLKMVKTVDKCAQWLEFTSHALGRFEFYNGFGILLDCIMIFK
jgi:hypothetical protein